MTRDQVVGSSQVIDQKRLSFFGILSMHSAYLSLAGFSNMLSSKISFRGFCIIFFAQLAGAVIMRSRYLTLP